MMWENQENCCDSITNWPGAPFGTIEFSISLVLVACMSTGIFIGIMKILLFVTKKDKAYDAVFSRNSYYISENTAKLKLKKVHLNTYIKKVFS